MNIDFEIHAVKALPAVGSYKNVVTKVLWAVVFSQNGAKSSAGVETFLDFDSKNVGSFTPVDQLDKDTLVSWVLEKEGGRGFIDMLTPIHQSALTNNELEKSLIDVNLAFVTPHGEIIIDQEYAAIVTSVV